MISSIGSSIYLVIFIFNRSHLLRLVLQHKPVPRHTLLKVHNRLIRAAHGPLVDPRVNAFVGRQLQHLADLRRRADQAAANLDLLDDQSERHELGDGVFRRADLNELSADVEETEVACQGKARAGDGGDDQVEAVGVGLLVAFFGGGDEFVL